MATTFKIGDFVWAKMKGFPAWPGKVREPTSGVKIPVDKKKKFVFFYHSDNYAWMTDDQLFMYEEHKDEFINPKRLPKGFTEAIKAIEDAIKSDPIEESMLSEEMCSNKFETQPYKKADLPSIDEELAIMTKEKKAAQKDLKSEIKMDNATPVAKTAKKRASTTPHAGDAKKPRKIKEKSTGAEPQHAKDDIFIANDTNAKQLDYRQFLSQIQEKPKKDARAQADYTFSSDELLSKDNIIATPAKIGFLGLGIMGSGMVTNLLRSGHEVTVWNRTPSKCRDFAKEGALRGNSPKEVVEQCDITFSCVSDPAALKELVFNDCGVLDGMDSDKGFVDLSSVDTDIISSISEAITAHGGRFLEAPVMGSREAARDGSLVVLAAGDKSLYDDSFSCFSAIGKKSYFLGETGAATKMKSVMNLLSGTVIAGLAESLALSEKVGLKPSEVMQVLEMSPMHCPLIKKLANDMIQSNYSEPNCKLQVMQKDLRIVVNMSDSFDQPLHVGAAVNEFFKKAKAKGYGEHDQAAIYRAADL